jgi:hypothetical protein
MRTRRKFMVLTALIAAAISLPQLAMAEEEKVQLLFVQTATDLKADGKVLRLVNVNKQTLYFSDRPVRIAGHMEMTDYLNEWKPGAGSDNFTADPPNAALSVFEPGKPENTLVVVTISNPVVDGNDLVYEYKLIDGEMPSSGGATALFIDVIGVGGGVGRGVHGVGAGRRGVGVR